MAATVRQIRWPHLRIKTKDESINVVAAVAIGSRVGELVHGVAR